MEKKNDPSLDTLCRVVGVTLPMPTIAAVSGHAATSRFLVAISHDYVLMKKERCVLYMSELDIGLTLPLVSWTYLTRVLVRSIPSIGEVDADPLQKPSPGKFNNLCLNHICFISFFFFKFSILESPKSKIQHCQEMF